MEHSFVDVSLIIVLAASLGIFAYVLRQPTIVAYLGTGVIVSAFGILNLDSKNVLEVMATFGITFLLFLVGLEMKFTELKSVGKAIILTGLGQIIFTSVIGYGITRLLGFEMVESIYIAIALTFSSTIIIVKLLSEKRDLQSLYGRIVVGFLLLQDFVAMIILIILSALQQNTSGSVAPLDMVFVLLKGGVLFALILWLSKSVIPTFIQRIARNQEMLFISSIAWAFGVALLVSSPLIGFSIEIGGFLAGLALAQSAEQFQINARIRPLRDFFIVIFFIVLGSSLVINDLGSVVTPAIILSLFVLIGNPLIVLIIMGILGYKKRTSFFASVTVAQISEFSLILMAMGLTIGHITESSVALVTLIGVITIMISTYMVTKSDSIYAFLKPVLSFFERKNHIEKSEEKDSFKGHTILVGAHRLGQYLLPSLDPKRTLIVEFDPVIAKKLQERGFRVLFGDITDPDITNALHIENAELLISTVPHMEENTGLLHYFQSLPKNKRPSIILNAQHEWEAKEYYRQKADYVLYPHFVSALHLKRLFIKGKWDKKSARELKKNDLKILSSV